MGMETITTPPDSPDALLSILRRPICDVYSGLDHGISLAETWRLQKMPCTASLWSHIVRCSACDYITAIDRSEWEFHALANSGMKVVCGSVTMRVLKALNGEPPHPGPSRSRMAFYAQDHRQLTIPGLDAPAADRQNLILVWSAVGGGQDMQLVLCKPKGVWAYGQPPDLEWRRSVEFGPDGDPGFAAPDDPDVPVVVIDPSEFRAADGA